MQRVFENGSKRNAGIAKFKSLDESADGKGQKNENDSSGRQIEMNPDHFRTKFFVGKKRRNDVVNSAEYGHGKEAVRVEETFRRHEPGEVGNVCCKW